MELKRNPEELAKIALELLNETDKLEQEKDWANAINKYQQAAEYLKQSGYLQHRIQDIYARIEEINNFIKQDQLYQSQIQKTQIEQLQDEAFVLLDIAKELELKGDFKEAIQQYMAAIKLLVKSGWTEIQLENLKLKVMSLAQNLDRQKLVQQKKDIVYSQQQSHVSEEIPFEPLTSYANIEAEQKSQTLKEYENKKKQIEEMQERAFAYIDEAKIYERDKNFDDAIKNYQQATVLLNSLGWVDQTQNIQLLIERLEKDKEIYSKIQAQKTLAETVPLEEKVKVESQAAGSEEKLRRQKLIEFEEKKKYEDEIQTKAFNLIDFAKRLEREKKYEEAIQNFESAIEFLRKISWDSYIQPILNFINDIKEKQQREILAWQVRKKREEGLIRLQKDIHEKQEEQIFQSAKTLDLKRREFEQQRITQIEKENQFYSLIENADKILEEKNDYDNAIIEYRKAIVLLKNMGSGWETYIPSIESTISNIESRKEYRFKMETELQKKKEEIRKDEQKFHQQIADQINQEREKLRQKEIELKIRDDETKYREQRKQTAFKFLDTAQNYINQGDLDKAIYAYQNAGNIFAEIQWTDELPLIENVIKELELKLNEFYLLKQKQIQERIETKTKEHEFQKQIAHQLQIERKKLKEREIALREHEIELKHREKRRKEAFKLLEEAQVYLREGDFDKSINIYRNTANIFAEIQWHDEINLIQTSINEIENQKREAVIKKQVEIQTALEREFEDNQFQEQISKEVELHQVSLKSKDISLRKEEEEIEFREARKEEALKLLDKAQDFLTHNKFDDAIEIYHNVANTFAQIQWTDEIPLIQNAIKEIEEKKKEKELWKRESSQKSIQEETSYQSFVDQIKFERELEKTKLMEQQEHIEKQKQLTSQVLGKQEEAFKILDEADILLNQEYFDEALEKYQSASSLFSEIGWESGYLTLLRENIRLIQAKKIEKEKENQLELDNLEKKQLEEQEFQLKISKQIQAEKERMRAKKIEIQKQEVMKSNMKNRRLKAFELMDSANVLLNQGQYEQSINRFRQAELILNEISFPTGIIKETITKVNEKKEEEELAKQIEIEKQLKREQQQILFQQQTAERMQIEKQKMAEKQIEVKKHEELKQYMERRKEDSFNLLEEAEMFMKQTQYDKALEFYRSAELILSEIRYPTESIREMISKIHEKKKEQEILKQKKIEQQLQKEKVYKEFQETIAESFKNERERLKAKTIQIKKRERIQEELEKRRQQAFTILDEAESFINSVDYDRAIERYRKAELILNELHFSTDAIKNMMVKVLNLRKQKEEEKELELQRDLERIEEERSLQALIEERKRQEKEKKIAQELAIEERETLIRDQINQREAAYSLLETGGKYLKGITPDYDKAISLYIQAKNILSENIGWEPEINNINELIKDLQLENANFTEKRRMDSQAQIKRQQEYDSFQEEMRRRKADYETLQEDQRLKLKDFEKRKRFAEELRDEGLKLIEEGKRRAGIKEFDRAYYFFNKAISHFKEIGWNEQVRYIETEIQNTHQLEERVGEEELRVKKIQAELIIQREKELEKLKEEDLRKRETIGEVEILTDEISTLIESKKQELILSEQQKREKVKLEAKEFRKDMGKMLQIKQELEAELEKAKEDERRKQEEHQKVKDREELDDIAKMIKEAAKKEKEK
ncbi:MAG: hypothetical protein ACTSP6_00955 [Promethearchaeota archaeon]